MTVFLLIFALLCGLLFLGFPVGFGLGLSGLIGLILSGQPVAINTHPASRFRHSMTLRRVKG